MRVLAARGAPGLSPGQIVGSVVPQGLDVMEAGSSLLVTDAAEERFVQARSLGLRFVAAVPLVSSDETRFGMLALVDARPHAFSARDLAILEHIGHRVSARYGGASVPWFGNSIFHARGMVSEESFRRFLGLELGQAGVRKGTVAVANVALEAAGSADAEAILEREDRTRLAIAALAHDRLAIFKRTDATSEVGAPSVLARVSRVLRARRRVHGIGLVYVEPQGPSLREDEVLRFASEALDRSANAQRGELVSFAFTAVRAAALLESSPATHPEP